MAGGLSVAISGVESLLVSRNRLSMVQRSKNKKMGSSISGEGMRWKEGYDDMLDLRFRERGEGDNAYREYELDKQIAERIVELSKTHTWRALAVKVTGVECQMMGQDLSRLAHWTLGLDW
jgi:hypothetical protein